MSTLFKQRLSGILSEAEIPEEAAERLTAFATIFNIKRQEANSVLNGKLPEPELLEKIANEFEVSMAYLRGESDTKITKQADSTAKATKHDNSDTKTAK
jgi:hypothetical protein